MTAKYYSKTGGLLTNAHVVPDNRFIPNVTVGTFAIGIYKMLPTMFATSISASLRQSLKV